MRPIWGQTPSARLGFLAPTPSISRISQKLQEPTLLYQGEGRWQWRQTSEHARLNLPG